mgnify:CR=1 FL=1
MAGFHNKKSVYWKDGKEYALNSHSEVIQINAIAVKNGNIALAGIFLKYKPLPAASRYVAIYWKNGQPTELTDGSNDGGATGVAIDDNGDVYVSGYYDWKTKYWKNGQLVAPFDASAGEISPTRMLAVGQKLYISGVGPKTRVGYWESGKGLTSFPYTDDHDKATDIAVSGDDVYVMGYNSKYQPFYLKNGVETIVSEKGYSNSSIPEPYHIAVHGNDVYVVGYDGFTNNGQCWKNGERILPNDNTFVARCITINSTGNRSNPPKQSTVSKRESRVESEVNIQPQKTLTPNTAKILTAPEEADLFFEENRKKPGIITTASGLQYEILKQGNGPRVSASDKIQVIHKKILMFGKEVKEQGGYSPPNTYEVRNLMKGLIEGITLMNVGSNYKLFIPAKLISSEAIKSGATMIFETEILGIIK